MSTAALVGRERELAELRQLLAGALAGSGALALLGGEPGIGKTRLAEALAAEAAARGARPLWGRCWEGEGATAFRPWVEALRQLLRGAAADDLAADLGAGVADLLSLLPELARLLPGLAPPPSVDPEEARFRLFDAVLGWLRAAAGRRPLLLVLEDLHWADASSLALLQFVARELAVLPLLLVGTYRDVELDRRHPLASVLPALRRERGTRRLALRGLDEPEVAALLEALLDRPSSEHSRQFAAALHDTTEGNPLFVQEIVRHLQENGRLLRRDGRWTSDARSIDELELPEGVREVIGRRLARLTEPTNRVLAGAAVLGRSFSFRLLIALSGQDEETVIAAIEEAQAAHLLEEERGGEAAYSFTHALLRQTLYEELSLPRRQRLHRRAADAIAQLYGDAEAHAAELAQHSLQAVPEVAPAIAIERCQRAGAVARARFAFEEAMRWFAAALELQELHLPADRERRCDLLLGLAEAQYLAGERAAARKTIVLVTGSDLKFEDPLRFGRAALLLGRIEGQSSERDHAETNAVLEDAIAVVKETDLDLAALLRAVLGARLLLAAPPGAERARQLTDEATMLATRASAAARAVVLSVWAIVRFDPEHIGEVAVSAGEIGKAATHGADVALIISVPNIRLALARAAGWRGDVDRCIAEFDSTLGGSVRRSYSSFRAVLHALHAALDGEFVRLEQIVAEMSHDRS